MQEITENATKYFEVVQHVPREPAAEPSSDETATPLDLAFYTALAEGATQYMAPLKAARVTCDILEGYYEQLLLDLSKAQQGAALGHGGGGRAAKEPQQGENRDVKK